VRRYIEYRSVKKAFFFSETGNSNLVEVILPPTANRPFYLGVGLPSGTHNQIFLIIDNCGFLAAWHPLDYSYFRALPEQPICGSESNRTHDHTLLSHLRLPQSGGQVKVKVTLRPTVSRPACPGVRRPTGTRDQLLFLFKIYFRQLWVCYFVVPSLTRGRVCNLLLLLVLASEVPLGSALSDERSGLSFVSISL
jgi:hypothetical protein